jgi:hypothetical protein
MEVKLVGTASGSTEFLELKVDAVHLAWYNAQALPKCEEQPYSQLDSLILIYPSVLA